MKRLALIALFFATTVHAAVRPAQRNLVLAGEPLLQFLQRLLGHAAGDKLGSLAVNADPRRIETTRRSTLISR